MSEDNRRLQQNQKTILPKVAFLWIMDCILDRSNEGLSKRLNDWFVYYKQVSQYINRWTGVLWIIVMFFINSLDSHSDGTHSLQMIHWWANDVKMNFSKSVPLKKQILRWPKGE